MARADVEGAQRELERGAARADRRRVGDADAPGELVLEPRHLGPLRQLAPADDPRDTLGVVVAESRPRVRDQRFRSNRTDWKASAYLTRA